MEEETDCIGAMTYIHWWGNWRKMQPETYVRDEVCGDLIEQMRCGPSLSPAPGGALRDQTLKHVRVLGRGSPALYYGSPAVCCPP